MTSSRARVVVSSTVSLDGRITVGADRLLLDPHASELWRSLHPPSAEPAFAARTALIEQSCHPTAVLEGSGSFVTSDTPPRHPIDPAADPPDDFLPGTSWSGSSTAAGSSWSMVAAVSTGP